MNRITINTEDAHGTFHGMAEGMWEVARDESGDAARAAMLERLIGDTPYREGMSYPAAFSVSNDIALVACDVCENLRDTEDAEGTDIDILLNWPEGAEHGQHCPECSSINVERRSVFDVPNGYRCCDCGWQSKG